MKKLLITLLLLLPLFTVANAKEDKCPVRVVMREPDAEHIDKKGRFVLGKSKFTTGWRYAGTEYFLVASGGKVSEETGKVEGAKWGIVDRNGKEKVPVDYDGISEPIHDMFYYCEKGLIGIYNIDMRQITKPVYASVGAFDDRGFTWVLDKKGKFGFISETGNEILPCEVKRFHLFASSSDKTLSSAPTPKGVDLDLDLYQAFPDSTYVWFTTKSPSMPGLIDFNGKVVVPEGKYNELYAPTDGMMRFSITIGKGKKAQKYTGFYDIESGREYETRATLTYYPFRDGVSLTTDGSEYWFVDKKLEDISGHYTAAYDFHEGYAVVGRGGLYGVVNRSGEEVVPLIYKTMEVKVTDGMVAVSRDSLWGAIAAATGEEVIPFEYDKVQTRRNCCFAVKSHSTWGLVGAMGKVYLQPGVWKSYKYPVNYPPADYLWVEGDDDLWYYYDMASEAVLFPERGEGFTDVWNFDKNGFATITKEVDKVKWYGAIRRDGSYAIPPDRSLTSEAALAKALDFLRENGYDTLAGAALLRYNIREAGTCNTHKLSDVIPDEEWDY